MAKEWRFNVEDDIHFIDYFKGQEPSKKKVLKYKKRIRPNYLWKAESLKNSRGFRLFYKKK